MKIFIYEPLQDNYLSVMQSGENIANMKAKRVSQSEICFFRMCDDGQKIYFYFKNTYKETNVFMTKVYVM